MATKDPLERPDPNDKTVAWYNERPEGTQLSAEARQLLDSYSKIEPDRVEDHVVAIREKAWMIFPYPCIGQFRFLDLSMRQTKEYPGIVERLKRGQKLLDMACCFGQEIRQLVADGAPAENMYGCDLRQEYIELGYELFGDRDRLKAQFLAADIFDESSALVEKRGAFDIVYAGSFFHLFDYDDQVKVSTAVAKLLRPVMGSMIVGRQVGAVNASVLAHRTNVAGKMFRQNPDTMRQMWKDIGDDLGVTFTVDATLRDLPADAHRFHNDDTKRIWFVIRRE